MDTQIHGAAIHPAELVARFKAFVEPYEGHIRKRQYWRAFSSVQRCLKGLQTIVGLAPVIGPQLHSIISIAVTILAKIDVRHSSILFMLFE